MINLEEFADEVGIARDYIDVKNQYTPINYAARLATLGALGYPIDDEEQLNNQIRQEKLETFLNILDPVCVLKHGDKPFILVRSLANLSDSAKLTWTLSLESGEIFKGEVALHELEIADCCELDGKEYDTRRFIIPYEFQDVLPNNVYPLPLGYHTFRVEIDDGFKHFKSQNMSLIIAPNKCYIPDDIVKGRKFWGTSIQLYTLRSKNNWGVGDFNDLKQLLKLVHAKKGAFVGLNPMHAGFPTNPSPDVVSPYSPASRLWLNVIYISVPDVEEYKNCQQVQALVNSKEFQIKLKHLRKLEYVDYKGVLDLKLEALKLIFKHAKFSLARTKAFNDFKEHYGKSILNMATYDAIAQSLFKEGKDGGTWRNFPSELHNINSPALDKWRSEHQEEVDFFSYLQFIAHEQLEDAYQSAVSDNMPIGIYRDLAVGVNDCSCDVWADTDNIYCSSASIGAPPDPLGPLGQDWGLAPMSPHALRKSGYKALIALYRANMQSCGALRIDHAAGLYRFWWVPPKHKATDGAYVYNHMHDWLGILALESQRNKCLVIAEDLGTIPMELRVALKEVGAFSYKLFFGERAFDGGYIAPQDYEPQALSAITTHDTPTLKGWWDNYDLSLGQELGIYTQDEANTLLNERNEAKQRMLDSMHGLNSIGSDIPYKAHEIPHINNQLVIGIEKHMCLGSCALFSSQLEDWTGVFKPVNVPGTWREYPNWRRKLSMDLEDMAQDPFIDELTGEMSKAREQASAGRKFGPVIHSQV